jgi:transposase
VDASGPTAAAPLPDGVPSLQAPVRQLLAEVAALRAGNAELRGKLAAALQQRGRHRSERRPRTKPPLEGPKQPRDPHGRTALPEQLERREVVHDLTEAEKLCPCCGQPRRCIGEQAAEQLDPGPARLFVPRTIKKTYACPRCDPQAVPVGQRFRTAGPAEVGPSARGLRGPGLLAQAITAESADHTPPHRSAGQPARGGIPMARSTRGDWPAAAADLLGPLYRPMRERVLLCRAVHGGDASAEVRLPGAGRAPKAHPRTCIGGADYPYVVLDFTTAYAAAAGPQAFPAGHRGYSQADALAQSEGLYGADKIQHVCCWAHARREFVAAAEGDETAQRALDWIGQLYAIERELRPLLSPREATSEQRRQREEHRRRWRQGRAEPVSRELKQWLEEPRPQTLPKSPPGQAVGYALNDWEALRRSLERGYLAIDNNLSERTLRAIAVGRNNGGVLGSEAGGRAAAVPYTMVGTGKHLQIDPFAYLREALPGLFALGEQATAEAVAEWLPDRWPRRRSGTSPPQAAAAG